MKAFVHRRRLFAQALSPGVRSAVVDPSATGCVGGDGGGGGGGSGGDGNLCTLVVADDDGSMALTKTASEGEIGSCEAVRWLPLCEADALCEEACILRDQRLRAGLLFELPTAPATGPPLVVGPIGSVAETAGDADRPFNEEHGRPYCGIITVPAKVQSQQIYYSAELRHAKMLPTSTAVLLTTSSAKALAGSSRHANAAAVAQGAVAFGEAAKAAVAAAANARGTAAASVVERQRQRALALLRGTGGAARSRNQGEESKRLREGGDGPESTTGDCGTRANANGKRGRTDLSASNGESVVGSRSLSSPTGSASCSVPSAHLQHPPRDGACSLHSSVRAHSSVQRRRGASILASAQSLQR
jgi:hypothetical protein